LEIPLQLTIEKLIYGGDGLARLPADEHGRGKAVFVPFVLPGEQVEASLLEEKPGFVRARAESVLQPSAQRIRPRCPYFLRCGGCHYQHAAYEHQLEIKGAILKENLRRIAKLELDTELQIHPSPPWNYRNRTRMRVRPAAEFALGYYQFGSHELLAVEECPISSPLINRAIATLWQAGREGKTPEGLQEIEFFANAEDTQLLIEGYCLPEARAEALKTWAQEVRDALPEVAGLVFFRQGTTRAATNSEPELLAVVGTGELVYKTEPASYRVSAGAFFQVNRHLISELVTVVTAEHSGRTVLDLYAGVGLFSAALAQQFERVVGVESSPSSCADLERNAPANVKVVRATVEQYLKDVAGRMKTDFVVVDPPRSGLGVSVTRSLAVLGAPRLTYVSCDPATLARDLGGLLAGGYRVQQAHLVDLFPQTYHLESVFQLVR
jgi:23S rRNA (uracil1939-C5)-methyltransferase